MQELTNQKTMTIKEVAEIFNCDESTIRKRLKKLFPDLMQNGKRTSLTQEEVTKLKIEIERNPYLGQLSEVKTDLEMQQKALEVMQWMKLKLDDEKRLRKEAEEKNKRLLFCGKYYTTSEIAKELGLRSAQQLNKILSEKGIIYNRNGTWIPTALYSERNLMQIKQEELENGYVIYHTKWTGIGRQYIIELLRVI